MMSYRKFLISLSLFFTVAAIAEDYQVVMGSHPGLTGQNPMPYFFRIDDRNGNNGAWIQVPPNKIISQKYDSRKIAAVEVLLPAEGVAIGILPACHQYLKDSQLLPDYSTEFEDFWDKIGSIQQSFAAVGNGFSFELYGYGSQECPAYATDCQISQCRASVT